MIGIPLMFIGFRTYHFFRKLYDDGGLSPSLGYYPDRKVSKFITPQMSYWERFRVYIASVVHELLTDKEIE